MWFWKDFEEHGHGAEIFDSKGLRHMLPFYATAPGAAVARRDVSPDIEVMEFVEAPLQLSVCSSK